LWGEENGPQNVAKGKGGEAEDQNGSGGRESLSWGTSINEAASGRTWGYKERDVGGGVISILQRKGKEAVMGARRKVSLIVW